MEFAVHLLVTCNCRLQCQIQNLEFECQLLRHACCRCDWMCSCILELADSRCDRSDQKGDCIIRNANLSDWCETHKIWHF
jgi:hypothetical protein